VWKNTSERYGSVAIAMHWLILLLLIAVYACIELRELFPKGSDTREALKVWHYMLGLSVFVLVWLRLAMHLSATTPRIVPEQGPWQRLSARLMHVALYIFMIGMPLAGWLLLSAGGKPIPFFGLQLPALVAENKGLANAIKEIHEIGGTIGYYLIGLHAAAALFHHYIKRDNTLTRMLPKRRTAGPLPVNREAQPPARRA
jgi:cytochrome b561